MSSKNAKMTWVDKGWARLVQNVAKGPANTHAIIGMLGPDADSMHGDSGLTTNQLGIIHEFGLGVPRRSFLRRALVWRNRREIVGVLAQVSRMVLFQGKSRVEAMKYAGRWGVQAVMNVLDSGSGPPPALAPDTVAHKGHDHALFETGELHRTIDYRIVTNGAIIEGSGGSGDGGEE